LHAAILASCGTRLLVGRQAAEFTSISLLADEATLRSHFVIDGRQGRASDSVVRLAKYESVDSHKIWVTGKSVEDVVSEIATLIA